MQAVRRLLALGLVLLVGVAAAMPLGALRCGSASTCPMMKMMAKAGVSCHAASSGRGALPGSSGMSMPAGCCRQVPASPSAPTYAGLSPAPAASPVAGMELETLVPAAVPGAPRADHQAIGLYTLHAVWRI